jgi:hypothetical protein
VLTIKVELEETDTWSIGSGGYNGFVITFVTLFAFFLSHAGWM